MRKRDSFNSKARPVSTGSVDSYKSGLHSQGSVKRKDARPPSIAEDEGNSATISQEVININIMRNIKLIVNLTLLLCRQQRVVTAVTHDFSEGN